MLILSFVCFVICLIFILLWMGRQESLPADQGTLAPISVIVAAHNESAHLPELLSCLLDQDFPDYEVILALDRPDEASLRIAEEFAAAHPRLRVLRLAEKPEVWTPKKWALEQAVGGARHERLAFTDADCRPPKGWLRAVDGALGFENELAIGASPYFKVPGLLNLFIRFETLMTAFLYLGAAGWGRPYMAVGRNLAYTKAFFRRSGGQDGIKHRLSGDDDLLVNRHGPGTRVGLIRGAGGVVPSYAKESFSAWRRQKMRHLSASGAYSVRSQAFLALLHGAHLIFYVSLIFVLFSEGNLIPVLCLFAAKNAVSLASLWSLARQWKALDLLALFPVLDLLYLAYILLIGPAGKIAKPKW